MKGNNTLFAYLLSRVPRPDEGNPTRGGGGGGATGDIERAAEVSDRYRRTASISLLCW